jgi:two-component system, NtrC family, response regulator AtoC
MRNSPQKQNGDALPVRRILVGDDEEGVRDVLSQLLCSEGYEVVTASTGQECLQILTRPKSERPELALLDIRMPGMDGIAILQNMLEHGVDIPVILMTGFNSSSLAIKAMQMGAADYLTKPFTDLDEVVGNVEHVLRYEDLKRVPGKQLVPAVNVDPTERIVGSSQDMVRIFKTIGQVARTRATVLITGETGTGKELMTEAIHNASDRRGKPLIKVNCAALPETLLESELFGHEKGSFTGAINLHKGRFEVANTGTIFLDEVGEMTLGTQKKLLRVLQEREFERVGGNDSIKTDVRVIAATNRTLQDDVVIGRFREDLYYRLNIIEIHMPPLRDRIKDVPALANHFLDKHRYTATSAPTRITKEAMDLLKDYEWPGNVRELENIVQRAVVLSRGNIITPDHLRFQYGLSRHVVDIEQKVRSGTTLDDILGDIRHEVLQTALRFNDHNPARAAAQIGISVEEFRLLQMEMKMAPGLEPASEEVLPRLRDA